MIKIAEPIIKKAEISAVTKVLQSGRLAQGPQVEKLEHEFSRLCRVKYAVAVSSGTSALFAGLYSLGLKPRDEVITTPFSFMAGVNAIILLGGRPVFIDIEEQTLNLDPAKIKPALTARTKAILAVNLYGQPADYQEINQIGRKYRLGVIEDAAQSIGAEYKKRPSGSLADLGCFSLYASKNITAGEGGMITTNQARLFQKAKRFSNQGLGLRKPYDYHQLGLNLRMTEMQAALALVQLKRLKKLTRKRQLISKEYNQSFSQIKGLIPPSLAPSRTHVYHQYTLRVTPAFKLSRDQLARFLAKKGIETRVHYPLPLHLYPHLKELGYKKGDFPMAEKVSQEVLSLPVHPLLKSQEVKYIIKTINKI